MNINDSPEMAVAYLIIIMLGTLPALLSYRRALSKYKAVEAELSMIGSMINYENMMRDGVIKLGDALHDHIYMSLNHAIRTRPYNISIKHFFLTKNEREIIQKIEREFEKGNPALIENLRTFNSAYITAFSYSRPWAATVFLASTIFTIITFSVILEILCNLIMARRLWSDFKSSIQLRFLYVATQVKET